MSAPYPQKRALIATLFNEQDSVSEWWNCLMRQTVLPDEISIVDGASTDGTWDKLHALAKQSPVPVILDQRRCNIAEGRNLAITHTDADIVAATDAGSYPEPAWFEEITGPLMEDPGLDVTGGLNLSKVVTPFQQLLEQTELREVTGWVGGDLHPSSRNTAFRRQAWVDVGHYPEWLTLAGEDSLFTHELNKIGKKFFYNPKAVVHWSSRETEAAYFKLLYRNAYGSAEAQLNWPYFRQRIIISALPFLLLLSRHRFHYFRFRYGKNFSSARGWFAGKISGHHMPTGWKLVDGIPLSPEAIDYLAQKK